MTTTKPTTSIRAFLEMDDCDTFVSVREMIDRAKRGDIEQYSSAFRAVGMKLKDVLGGIAPIFGRDNLLAACAAIIDEDFNPDGPQTASYNETNERLLDRMFSTDPETAAPSRTSKSARSASGRSRATARSSAAR